MRSILTALAVLLAADLASAQGLPPVPAPPENPITADKAVLGKILFWDEQLSSDDTMACGTCHLPQSGGADPRLGRHPGYDALFGNQDDVIASPGVVHLDAQERHAPVAGFGLDVQVTGRSAQSAITSQWSPEQFWDGRATSRFVDPETNTVSIQSGGSLESQAVGPVMSTVEMGHDGRTWTEVAQKLAAVRPLALATNLPADVQLALQRDPTYQALFQRAFGSPAITAERIGFALATYERTLVANQTPWDRHIGGNPGAMTMSQRQGFQRFRALQCDACHPPPFFTDHSYRVLGVRPWVEDEGRKAITNKFEDRGAFKVPSLRNVGLKSTFMHNGALTTMAEVVDFYDHLIVSFPDNQDPLYQGMSIPAADRPLLIDFLVHALTDPRVAAGLPPFDRPTLRSELAPNQVYGQGSPGSGAVVPQLIGHQPATVGAPDFRVGIRDARGGAPTILLISGAPRSYPGLPLPIHVDLDAGLSVTGATAGVGAGQGYGTFPLSLPNDPNLRGATLHFQALVIDPAGPLGLAASDAVAIPVH
jgi:cytochrome c peroxidase